MISRKIIALSLYITIISILFIVKPAMIFDDDGNMKGFDYDTSNNDSSLLSFTILLPFIAILCYFIITVIEMVIT